MDDSCLKNGVITFSSIDRNNIQDYIEVKLKDGNTVIVTASCNGKLKIGTIPLCKGK